MPDDNNEHQRLLKQQAHQEKRRAFYLEHGRWPADGKYQMPLTLKRKPLPPQQLTMTTRLTACLNHAAIKRRMLVNRGISSLD
jgi:hypothetical protein